MKEIKRSNEKKLNLTVGKYVGIIVEGELDMEGTFDIVGIIVFCLVYSGYEYGMKEDTRR